MIVWHFEAVLHSGVKLCQLEAVIYAVPEVALFLLYVHLTIGYRKCRIDSRVVRKYHRKASDRQIRRPDFTMEKVKTLTAFALYNLLVFTAAVIKVLLYYHVTDQRDYPVMAALCIFIVVGITALHLLKYRYIMIIYLMTVTTALALTIG